MDTESDTKEAYFILKNKMDKAAPLKLNKQQFDEWIFAQREALFGVQDKDKHELYGVRVDWLHIINAIAETPSVMLHKTPEGIFKLLE